MAKPQVIHQPAAAAANGSESSFNAAEVGAILECLEYLQSEALKNGYRMAAHLIGAASEDMKDRLLRDQTRQLPS